MLTNYLYFEYGITMKKISILFYLSIQLIPLFASDNYIYPQPLSDSETRYDFQWKILKEALDATVPDYGNYTLNQSESSLPEVRHVRELERGNRINVIREITNRELEEKLLPVRIPIQKGLLGYRIFLINKKNKDLFMGIQNLTDLKRYSIGQGTGWGDVAILKSNGFTVIEAARYDFLLRMLINGRFWIFSRGISEAPVELEEQQEQFPDLYLDSQICLQYPFAEYFFFNKKDTELAKRVETGLLRLIDSGKYDELFNEQFGDLIHSVDLNSRTIYKIDNPHLPETTPVDIKKYWIDPTLY